MSLASGSKLGPYEILAPLGAGGMGEVFKARDTRLDRIVAIKTSKAQFSERFAREARAIAALNHPHICQLYDVGPDYLVMEYVEGSPLKGPLPEDKAVEYAGQILSALDAAHRKGITHRDLKPANIMVTKQHGIKLLDFGLARIAAGSADSTVTVPGEKMGTPAYMSPEQWDGKPGDARSDIYAFGCVLYEMLTGKRALHEERPPVKSPPLERVMRRVLAKDPDQRFQTAREVKTALEWAIEPQAARGAGKSRRWKWIAAAALVIGVLAGAWGMAHFRQPAAADRVLRLDISPPDGGRFVPLANTVGGSALSPDGRMAAFVAAINGKTGLWVRALDDRAARLLPGTEGAGDPFWSPDSKSIAFSAAGKLQRVDLAGGSLLTICDVPIDRGGAWSDDGQIVFGSLAGGLLRVPHRAERRRRLQV